MFGSNKDQYIDQNDPMMMGGGFPPMPKPLDPFTQSKEFMLGQQPSVNRDAEVLIRLFSTDKTMSELISTLTGKIYDREKKEYIDLGTSHINYLGLKEIIPFLRFLINDSTSKSRLEEGIIESNNFAVHLRVLSWLGKNRVRFEMRKESIPLIAQMISELHYNILSRARGGAESDNMLIHTINHRDTVSSPQEKSYIDKMLEPKRIGTF